jgi:hypothetical protein
MLTFEDREYLVEQLFAFAKNDDAPRRWLTTPFIGTTMADDLRGTTPRELVVNAVAICERSAWQYTPCWLRLLVSLLPYAADARLQTMYTWLGTPPPLPPDPFDAHVLPGNVPFVNRITLRQHLRTLLQGPPHNILIVGGDPKAGKSYSEALINACFSRRALVCLSHFSPEFGATLKPVQVAKELVLTVGGNHLEAPVEDSDEQVNARLLAAWVLGRVAHSSQPHCIVLDNFRGPELNQPMRLFLRALIDGAGKGVFAQRGWLILIGCDVVATAHQALYALDEHVVPADNRDVAVCVDEILRLAGVPFARDPVTDAVTHSLPDPPERMTTLNTRLRASIRGAPEVAKLVAQAPNLDGAFLLAGLVRDLPAGDAGMSVYRERLTRMREAAGA